MAVVPVALWMCAYVCMCVCVSPEATFCVFSACSILYSVGTCSGGLLWCCAVSQGVRKPVSPARVYVSV